MSGTNGEPRWLNDDEQQAWRATVHLSQLLMRQLDRDLTVHGLNGHDYEILVELSEAPDSRLRMTELADATSQSRSRLSPRQREEIRDAFGPIVDYLRKIRDRD